MDGHLTVLRQIHKRLLAESLCVVLHEEDGVTDADGENLGLVSTLGHPGLAGAPLGSAVA